MSKVVFTTQLVERIGLLGDVMASFLDEQVGAIQKRLSDKYPDAAEDAAWTTISKFATLEGTKIPKTKEEVMSEVPYPEAHLDFMLNLFDKARILRLADGIYEIAHDTLALQVSEKRSGDEKALLEVKKLITDRYAAYVQTGALLSSKEINFVSPYKERLDMTEEQDDFYGKSRKNVRRRRAILIGALIAAFSIISLFAIYALLQQREAIAQKKIAEAALVEAKRQEALAIENAKEAERQKEKAIKAAEEARIAQRKAEEERQKALEAKRIAEEERRKADRAKELAVKAQKEAEVARDDAEQQRQKAVKALKVAEEQRKKAEKAQKIAEAQQKIAEAQQKIADLLRTRALARALAIKSANMKYDERLKGLLAMKAYSLQENEDRVGIKAIGDSLGAVAQDLSAMRDTLQDKDKGEIGKLVGDVEEMKDNLAKSANDALAPPEIYTGLYSATNMYEGEGFDEIEEGHKGAVRGLIYAGNSTVYSASSDGYFTKWGFKDWKDVGRPQVEEKKLSRESSAIDLVAKMSPDGRWMALGGKQSSLEIINLKSNEVTPIPLQRLEDVYDIEFSEDSKRIYFIGSEQVMRVYSINDKQVQTVKLKKMNGTGKIEQLAISPDGKHLAIGSKNGWLQLYNTADFSRFKEEKIGKEITALSFDNHENNHENRLVAGTVDGSIYLLEEKQNYEVGDPRKVHNQRISVIRFKKYKVNEATMNVMAVGSYDGVASVWIVEEFRNELYEPLRFENNQKWVMSMDFVDEGRKLAVGYLDGKIKFWTLRTETVAQELCSLIGDEQLSEKELKKFLGEDYKTLQVPSYCDKK